MVATKANDIENEIINENPFKVHGTKTNTSTPNSAVKRKRRDMDMEQDDRKKKLVGKTLYHIHNLLQFSSRTFL